MADSTTFRGDAAQFLDARTPNRRRTDSSDIAALRARVRDLGTDLRRNWNTVEPRRSEPETKPFSHPSRDFAPPEWREPEGRVDHFRAAAAKAALFANSVPDPAFAVTAARSVLGWLSARGGLALKALTGALLALATAGLLRDWPVGGDAPVAPSIPPVAWIDIARPYPLFELVAPGVGQPVYTARRHAAGGGREDVLTFGQFGGAKLFLRLSVYRHGGEEVADPIYFVDMARRASGSGLGVTEAELPQAIPTRFGDFESGPLQLSGPANVKRGNCRGFRLDVATPALTMGGFMCGAGEEKIGVADVACLIDRLDLIAAGEDRELADFFGAAGSRKSRACADSRRK